MSVFESFSTGGDVPVDGLDHAGLGTLASQLCGLRCWIDRQLVRVCTAAGPDGRDLLAAAKVLTARELRAIERRGEVAQRLPPLAHVPGAHQDAVANAMHRLGGHAAQLEERAGALAERALACGPDRFAAHARAVVAEVLSHVERSAPEEPPPPHIELRRWTDHASGAHHYHLSLDAETADQVDTQLDAEIKRLWASSHKDQRVPDPRAEDFGAIAAGALVGLVTGSRGRQARTPQVVVVVDYETLAGDDVEPGAEHRSSKGTLLAPETLRRYACDAELIPVVLGSQAQPLDVGRAARSPTPAQRTALRALYPVCAVPGCSVGFDWCHLHHVVHWTRGGPTNLDNLVPLCAHHHHRVHEGGWNLGLEAGTRVLTISYRDGRLHSVSQPEAALAVRERRRRRRARRSTPAAA